MSYRGGGGGITGTNNIPLGNRRRFGGESDNESPAAGPSAPEPREYSPQNPNSGLVDLKRGRSPIRCRSLRPALLATEKKNELTKRTHSRPRCS